IWEFSNHTERSGEFLGTGERRLCGIATERDVIFRALRLPPQSARAASGPSHPEQDLGGRRVNNIDVALPRRASHVLKAEWGGALEEYIAARCKRAALGQLKSFLGGPAKVPACRRCRIHCAAPIWRA